jgi:hypothetical protein
LFPLARRRAVSIIRRVEALGIEEPGGQGN